MPSTQTLPATATLGLRTSLALCLFLFSAIVFGILHTRPPAFDVNITPATEFSVQRAQTLLAHIANQAHPVGTPENAQVAQYLIAQLRSLGVETEVQEGVGVSEWSIGKVRNVVGRLAGADPRTRSERKALLLVAHYDSAPNSPGAADNGASVAAVLETLRALQSGPKLANDVIVLFSDGEETGSLGAQLFASQHPWRKDVGMVLNFEYRGNRGPFWMYETSPGNAKLIAGLQQAVPQMHANSVLYEVYKYMPNYTDFTQFKKIGLPGLNFAAIEGHTYYHTQRDNLANLDIASWQDEGRTMLAATRYFGAQDLRQLSSEHRAENRIYFDLPGWGLLSYSSNWPTSLVLCALLFTCLLLAKRQQRIGLLKSLLASLICVANVAILAGASAQLWQMLLALHPSYAAQVHGSIYNQNWYFCAFLALALALFVHLQKFWQRWFKGEELFAGACLIWLGLVLACSFVLEGAALVFTWPLLAVLCAWLLVLVRRPRSPAAQAWTWAAGLWPGVLLLTPLLHLIFIALTPSLMAAGIVVFALLLGLMAALFFQLGARLTQLAYLSWALGLVLLVGGSLTAGTDEKHPQANHLAYVYDGVADTAYWFSRDAELDTWQKQFITQEVQQRSLEAISFEPKAQQWLGKAAGKLKVPEIEVLSDRVLQRRRGPVRAIELQISSPRNAAHSRLTLTGGRLYSVQLQDHKILSHLESPWHFNTYGFGATGLQVVIEMEVGSKLQVQVLDRSYHLPHQAAKQANPPRPLALTPRAFSDSDTSMAYFAIDL